jgi:hypothetical protein
MNLISDNLGNIDNDIDEDMKLTRDDYIKILHHYQQRNKSPKNTNSRYDKLAQLPVDDLQKKAHTLLGNKFCKCIRPRSIRRRNSSGSGSEQKRISYCTRSIFNNRGLKRHGFRCRNRTNKLTQPMTKTQKKLNFDSSSASVRIRPS